ncbi:deoxyribodipyrimidine photo-lyase [Gemmobacter fulvus]|uniref:cryptochrome/photolyase family protein n=1 Tax=Gemmobacter fulvus TaxID=2840474 RepID=UPI0027968F42|nr:deoxyribodipyrimidine photo-lyase [Gemmobacter fulvus]MDQ1849296.1 deoxyribodipyrimidine photo-lyase [Gemmobacter fulvus]
MSAAPLLLWFRRDLRLADHPMLSRAVASGRPLIPLFILDPETEAIGAAAKWRLGLSLADFAARLAAMGSRLILRRGPALPVLEALLAETGAEGVHWSRLYDPASKARDTAVKAALKARGVAAVSHDGFLLHEPMEVQTGQGSYYKVYTPFWNAVRGRDVPSPDAAPKVLAAPDHWPASEALDSWQMGRAMWRGAAVCLPYQAVGEAAARDRLSVFVADKINAYRESRDFPARDATSRLSENLTYGEIGPRLIWHEGRRAMQEGAAGAEHFLKELVWREFAWHLLHHTPHIATQNWREDWQAFPWQGDSAAAERWRRGMTGEPFVDAAMREMYVTGTMHNRARMIVGSYLTKHLLTDWRVGQAWFAECLTDWDPAANAMGWQWVAGSGPDAAPYFRVFNPAGQAEKFDPNALYRRRFIAELSRSPPPEACQYFEAVPRRWGLDPQAPYPTPMIALEAGRARALAAYAARNAERNT